MKIGDRVVDLKHGWNGTVVEMNRSTVLVDLPANLGQKVINVENCVVVENKKGNPILPEEKNYENPKKDRHIWYIFLCGVLLPLALTLWLS